MMPVVVARPATAPPIILQDIALLLHRTSGRARRQAMLLDVAAVAVAPGAEAVAVRGVEVVRGEAVVRDTRPPVVADILHTHSKKNKKTLK
jgi:hypothetical protein